MKKVLVTSIRLTLLLDERIEKYSHRLHITKSDLVYRALMYYLKDEGDKDLERVYNLEVAKAVTKEDNYHLYLGKNALMTLITMAKASLLLTGEINVDKMKLLVKNYKKIYKYFPARIKKVLKPEMNMIKKLQQPSNLKEYIQNWDLVQEFIHVNKQTKRIELK